MGLWEWPHGHRDLSKRVDQHLLALLGVWGGGVSCVLCFRHPEACTQTGSAAFETQESQLGEGDVGRAITQVSVTCTQGGHMVLDTWSQGARDI